MIVGRTLRLDIDELRRKDAEKILRKLTFVNGDGDSVSVYRQTPDKLILPRGAWSEIPNYIRWHDRRSFPSMPELEFTKKLDDVERDPRFEKQSQAVKAMFEEEQGLIIRPPGTGKTQIALAFIAACKTRSLVLVHTQDILDQWRDYALEAIPGLSVGVIQAQRLEIGHLTIATVQTLRHFIYEMDAKWWQQFGCVILDEAHHGPAQSFSHVLNTVPAKYRFGFTASDTRADGMEPALPWLIGPVIHRVKFSSPVKLTVRPVRTAFRFSYRGSYDWGALLRALITDPGRNAQIAKVVNREVAKGNTVLVLSRRIEHLEEVSARLECENEILTAKRKRSERKSILADFRNGDIPCVLATQLADESLDIPRLNRVCLIHPGKHEGRIIQQIGRGLRKFEHKKDVIIFDFVDFRIKVLRRQWLQRRATYKKLKIRIRKRRNRVLGRAA